MKKHARFGYYLKDGEQKEENPLMKMVKLYHMQGDWCYASAEMAAYIPLLTER